MNKIEEFYKEKYTALIRYAKNKKKGGDGTVLDENNAQDIVHKLFLYHITHPSKFSPKYIWNSIRQYRINLSIENQRRLKAIKDYKDLISNEEREGVGDPIDKLTADYYHSILEEAIMSKENLVHREVLTRNLLCGESIREAVRNVKGSHKMIINRFKRKMIKIYGGGQEK